MDVSISYLFKFLFGEASTIFTALSACNMNLGMLAIIMISFFSIPFIGLLLYWGTNRIARLNPWNLSPNQIFIALIATGGSLFFLELLAHPYLDRWIYNKHHKNLPFGGIFLEPSPQCISLSSPIALPRDEKETRKRIPSLTAASHPNLYLFVIETLRRDFINCRTAPHMMAFAEENMDFSSSFSNSNWTAASWFAIFHSDFPYNWRRCGTLGEEGVFRCKCSNNWDIRSESIPPQTSAISTWTGQFLEKRERSSIRWRNIA